MHTLRVCSFLNTFAFCAIAWAACPFDVEPDGDIDLSDYQTFEDCLSGPGVAIDPACQPADSNRDGFVDLGDFQEFQRFFTGDGPPALVVSPTMLVVNETGGTQQLRVFTELDMFRCEVTDQPATLFESSDPSVVSIDPDGVMTFQAEGAVQITASFGGLMAIADIDVDTTAMPLVQAPVGMAGGPVHLANGTGVDIPAGSLPASFMIQVEQVAVLPPGTTLPVDSAMPGPAYDFTPTDLSFDRDITLTVAYDRGQIPAGYDEDTALVHVIASDGTLVVEPSPGPAGEDSEGIFQELDMAGGKVSVSTSHFSCRAIVVREGLVETTLTAPDGTTLRVFRHDPFPMKDSIGNDGTDNMWGLPNCDDNNRYGNNDIYECFLNGPGPCVPNPPPMPGCTRPAACIPGPGNMHDDFDEMLTGATWTRTSGDIQHIVLHSTEGAGRFGGTITYATERCNRFWAQYYVGKDGTIVQISPDTTIAQHIRSLGGITNDNSIGIEIDHPASGGANAQDHYPGRQVSAIIRLCDFLLRSHPTIARPSAADPDGGLITHAAQDATRKTDPTNQFRTAVMNSPSIEEIIYRALRDDGHEGLINAKGGDAFGTDVPGDGGMVKIEAGVTALANDFDDSRTTVQVAAGNTLNLAAPFQRMHILVDGTLNITTDLTEGAPLDIDGILYVGPDGLIDARRGFDGASGRPVHIDADGFALIEGRVLLNGTDKLNTTELAPFNQAPFPGSGSGAGLGGFGGDFVFRGASPGPIWVPTIVTRGGDADSTTTSSPLTNGGDGGYVEIIANNDEGDNAVFMFFEGKANACPNNVCDPNQHQNGVPDYLPPPAPFNQMPVISMTPIASGTCGVPSNASTPSFVRPITNERLALGRFIDANTRAVGNNVSAFTRGIITVGGIGGAQSDAASFGGRGGFGGNITIDNATTGKIRFVNDVQLFTGAGAEKLAYVFFVTSCPDGGAFRYFEVPTGGTGGKGALNSGDGGDGGQAGDITITGIIHPHAMANAPTPSSMIPILGHDDGNAATLDNANITIGSTLVFMAEGFSTNSVRGSGGSPGGSSSTFPGFFGFDGLDGFTVINGVQRYP